MTFINCNTATIVVFLISLFMLFYVLCPADNVFVNATVRMLLLCCRHCKWVAYVNLLINGDDDDDDDDDDDTAPLFSVVLLCFSWCTENRKFSCIVSELICVYFIYDS